MTANPRRFPKIDLRTATVLSGLVLAACASPQFSSPQQVEASNPSTTYKYRSDGELIEASRSAETFCTQYQSVPRVVEFSEDPDGSETVEFECVKTSAAAGLPPQNRDLTYTYRTDEELLEASRSAEAYCESSGFQQMTSSFVTNANGTRTVTFHCGPA